MRFRGVFFEKLGQRGSRIESAFDVEWSEAAILGVLGHADAPDKSAQQLWAAAEYLEGTRRGNAGLNTIYAAVLDCDCADVGELDRACRYLSWRGTAHLAYTSWSHGLSDKAHPGSGKTGPFDCFRLVVPYSRPVTPAEHIAIVPALFGFEVPADPAHYAAEVLGRFITAANGTERAARPRGWDPASARPSQAYYLPSARSTIDVATGAPIDVEVVLGRPATARPTMKRIRPYQAPDRAALGALGRVAKALAAGGSVIGAEGYEGWHRAACPVCAPSGEQRSPSFTARANGDGIDLRCYAGCSRAELLKALGLEGVEFRAPTGLQLLLEEQLAAQAPSVAVSVDAAVERLVVDIRESVNAREPTIVKYPAGTGKSFAAAKVLTEVARAGLRIAYATQEHAVAHETRSLLPEDVYARSVHVHSPLVQVGTEPVCARRDELKQAVFEFGVSLLGSLCPRCPLRETCNAYAAARQRANDVDDASVVFVSHAGIRQIFNDEKGHDTLLIVDEMPGTYERVEVSRLMLERLASGEPMPSAEAVMSKAANALALAWSVGSEPGDIYWGFGGEKIGSVRRLCEEHGRLRIREGAHPHGDELRLLEAADALIRLSAFRSSGGTVDGLDRGSRSSVSAMVPDAAHEALVRRRGVLLSATPMMIALPGFRLRECSVTDGARVHRKMVLCTSRGSKALTRSYLDPHTGLRSRRDADEHEGLGVPWPAVDAALARALVEAERYPDRKVLFVTFKPLADALRGQPDRLADGRVEIAHYGALRGKNDWMQGAAKECSVVYLFGTPRQAVMPTILQLGLVGEAADQAWIEYAAGELAQAEGRLRMPRRTRECTVFVEGDVAPSTWHIGNVDTIIEDSIPTAAEYLEGAMLWRSPAELAETLGVDVVEFRGLSEKLGALIRAAMPTIAESFGLRRRFSSPREKMHAEWLTWDDT